MKFIRRIPKIMVVLVPMWAIFFVGQAFARPQGLALFNESVNSVDQACPPVSNTPYYTFAYGTVTLDGANAPAGTMVEAFSPRGDLVGCTIVSYSGDYGAMYIYGEDNSINPPNSRDAVRRNGHVYCEWRHRSNHPGSGVV